MVQPASFTEKRDLATELCRCGAELGDHQEFTFEGKTRDICPETVGEIIALMIDGSFSSHYDDRSPEEARAEARGDE